MKENAEHSFSICFALGMKKSVRIPNMSEQHLLDGVSVRLICDRGRKRYDAFPDEQHYLKSGQRDILAITTLSSNQSIAYL